MSQAPCFASLQSDADRGGGLTRPIGRAAFVDDSQPVMASLGVLRRARGLYTYEFASLLLSRDRTTQSSTESSLPKRAASSAGRKRLLP